MWLCLVFFRVIFCCEKLYFFFFLIFGNCEKFIFFFWLVFFNVSFVIVLIKVFVFCFIVEIFLVIVIIFFVFSYIILLGKWWIKFIIFKFAELFVDFNKVVLIVFVLFLIEDELLLIEWVLIIFFKLLRNNFFIGEWRNWVIIWGGKL